MTSAPPAEQPTAIAHVFTVARRSQRIYHASVPEYDTRFSSSSIQLLLESIKGRHPDTKIVPVSHAGMYTKQRVDGAHAVLVRDAEARRANA